MNHYELEYNKNILNKEKINQIVNELVARKAKLHEIPDHIHTEDQTEVRRLYLSRISKIDLTSIRVNKYERANIANIIENCIGAIKIPIGIAGPLTILRREERINTFIPLATTEGALVASINRGISICNQHGGINTELLADGMTRAPLFKGRDVRHIKDSVSWIQKQFTSLADCCQSTSSHCRLIALQPFQLGHILNLRMVFDTGEAMGMNMATFAAEQCSKLILENTGLELISIAGNLCSDKKPSAINAILGRGKTVTAWLHLEKEMIEKRLRTSVPRLLELIQNKVWLGSAYAHSISFNAHTANIIAAIFAATGQDLGQIVESSNAFIWTEMQERRILFTVQLQSLEVGTIGGGTILSGPSSLLKLMGCIGPGSSKRMAETICAAVLAGELSYLGALAAGEAAKAHRRFRKSIAIK